MEEFSGPLVLRRDDGEPRSAMGGGAIAAREENCGQRAGPLHAWEDQRGAEAAIRIGGVRRTGPDGYEGAGETDGARRRGDRWRDNGRHGNGCWRLASRNSRTC